MTEDFFANIASFVPKLQLLRIITYKKFSDSFIHSLNSLKTIQNVEHIFFHRVKRTKQINNWYFGKSVSEVMLSPNGMNVKHINDNCGLITEEENLDWDVNCKFTVNLNFRVNIFVIFKTDIYICNMTEIELKCSDF